MSAHSSPDLAGFDVHGFINGYVEALLWAGCFGAGEESESVDGHSLDLTVSDDTRDSLADDCRDFIAANRADLDAYCERMGEWHGSDTVRGSSARYSAEESAGADFYLSRAGHGAGYFDRGLGELGERLQDAARVYGDVALIDSGDGTAELFY